MCSTQTLGVGYPVVKATTLPVHLVVRMPRFYPWTQRFDSSTGNKNKDLFSHYH